MSWYNDYTEAEVGQAIANALAGGGGASLIHQASRTLTNAEFLAASNTSPELAGAPGASKWITNITGQLMIDAASPYVWDAGAAVFFGWGAALDDATAGLTNTSLPFIFDGSAIQSALLVPPFAIIGGNPEAASFAAPLSENQPLTCTLFNNSVPITGGDPSDKITLSALFYVFDRTQGKFLTTVESHWNETTRTFS